MGLPFGFTFWVYLLGLPLGLRFLKNLIVVVDRFKACFGLDDYRVYMPHKFHFTEFELTRNMMAVMIGYMFGLRATTLFD